MREMEKTEALGFLSVLVTYLNCYNQPFSVRRLIALALLGLVCYVFLFLYSKKISDRCSDTLDKYLQEAFNVGTVAAGIAIIFMRNGGFFEWFLNEVLGIYLANRILEYLIIFGVFLGAYSTLMILKKTRGFLDRLGSCFFVVLALQPGLRYVGKFWETTYAPIQGLIRVFLLLAAANVIGYLIRRIVKKWAFCRQIFIVENRFYEILFYILFVGMLFLTMLQNTYAISLFWGRNMVYDSVIKIGLVFSLCIFSGKYEKMENRLVANLLLFVAVSTSIYYITCGEIFIYAVYVFALGAIGYSDKNLVKLALFTSVVTFLTVSILSMVGFLTDTINRQSFGVIHNLGYGNENWVSMQLTSIILMFIYIRSHQKKIDKLINFVVVLVIFFFEKTYTGGRTAIYGAIYVFVGMIVYYLAGDIAEITKTLNEKAIYWINVVYSELVLVGSIVFSLGVSWIYYDDGFKKVLDIISQIPALHTTMNRFDSSYRGLHSYVPKLFGQVIVESNNSGDFFWLDTLYVRQLLKHGIAIFVCFFVLLTLVNVKLCARRKYYQAYAISSIPLMGIFEALVGDPMYNVFTMIALGNYGTTDEQRYEGDEVATRISAIMNMLAVVFMLPVYVYTLKTIMDSGQVINNPESPMLFWTVVLTISLTYFANHCAAKVIAKWLSQREVEKKRIICFVGAICAVLFEAIICFVTIIKIVNKDETRISEEKEAIEYVCEKTNGKVYAITEPVVYTRFFPAMNRYLYNCEALGYETNVTLIVDSAFDSSVFGSRGYLYMPLSDKSALYTNDEALYRGLKERGYKINGYCSHTYDVDVYNLAALNALDISDNGGISLGDSGDIFYGPYVDLDDVKYTATYNLKTDMAKSEEDYRICTIVIFSDYGEKELASIPVMRNDFDENGMLKRDVQFIGGNAVEFKLLMEIGKSCELESINYRKTPDYDRFIRIDDDGDIIYAEYYDTEGTPVLYLGKYFITRRTYNDKKLVILEEFFGLDEKPILLPDGASAYKLEYDDAGNVALLTYLDQEGNPTINTLGYAYLKRVYDEKKRTIREDYYGIDERPITLTKGQAAVEYEYDEAGNRTIDRYFDAEGNPTLYNGQYYFCRRTYNENKQVILEEYFGTDGLPAILSDGASSYSREYDSEGNNIIIRYIGVDGKPNVNTFGYAMLRRAFNDKKQITREDYYDETDHPIILSRGQAAVEYEYDEAGNRTTDRYYDTAGNPVLYAGEYWYVIRTYNDKKQDVHEEYYGLDGKLILLSSGYCKVDIKYNDEGAVAEKICYDLYGAVVPQE